MNVFVGLTSFHSENTTVDDRLHLMRTTVFSFKHKRSN